MNSNVISKLSIGQFSVIFAEVRTGIVVKPNGEWYLQEGSAYLVFDSEKEAENFAQAYVEKNPEIECSIRDKDGNQVNSAINAKRVTDCG